jgi:hypothetical protein
MGVNTRSVAPTSIDRAGSIPGQDIDHRGVRGVFEGPTASSAVFGAQLRDRPMSPTGAAHSVDCGESAPQRADRPPTLRQSARKGPKKRKSGAGTTLDIVY